MLTLAALLALSQGTITYQLPMSTTKDALAEIGRQSGKDIEHEGVGHLPIFIDAKGVEVRSLLDLVAKATDADLSATTHGFRLVRSPSRMKSARDVEKAEAASRLAQAIEKKKGDWAASSDWSEKGVQAKLERIVGRLERSVRDAGSSNAGIEQMHTEIIAPLGGDSPAGALLVKLLTTLPPSTWVGDSPSGIVRLSDRPNQFQRRLNVDLTRDYNQLIQTQNAMRAQLVSRLQLDNRTNVGFGTRDLRAGEVSRSVVLANWQHGNWLALNLYLVDANGNVVSRSNLSLSLPDGPRPESGITSETAVKTLPETRDLAKALRGTTRDQPSSSYSMSFDNYSVSLGQSVKMPKLSPNVLARMTREQDPFEDFVGPGLRELASEEKKPLVAVLPDRLFGASLDLFNRDSFTLKSFGEILRRADVKVDRSEAGIVVQPRLVAHLDRELANRAALYKFSRELATQGFATLGQTVAYAKSRMDTFSHGEMDFMWLQAINAATVGDMGMRFDVFRLYADLPERIRKGVEAEPVTGELLRIVGNRLTNHHGGAIVIGDGTAMMRSSSPRAQHIGTVDVSEPLAMGSIQIRVENSETDSLFVQRDSEGGGRFIRPQELGIYRAMSSNPSYTEFTAELLPYDSYQKAKSRRVVVSLSYDNGQGFLSRDELQDNSIIQGGGKWTYSSLPADIKGLIAEGEKLYKSRYGGGG